MKRLGVWGGAAAAVSLSFWVWEKGGELVSWGGHTPPYSCPGGHNKVPESVKTTQTGWPSHLHGNKNGYCQRSGFILIGIDGQCVKCVCVYGKVRQEKKVKKSRGN